MQDLPDVLKGTRRLLFEVIAGAHRPRDARDASGTVIRLCDTAVVVAIEGTGAAGPTFVNLHENEQTSVAAARAVVAGGAGRLVRLRSRGRRRVVFWDGVRPHAFDPNRIFSDAGIRDTLVQHASSTARAFAAVASLRDALLAVLVPATPSLVVALHNNEGTRYTVLDYGSGGRHEHAAAASWIGTEHPPDEFFIVTEDAWFDRLKRERFNVVLQSPTARDDGSLSVWFQRNGRGYINVEAKHGRLQQQRRMLEAIVDGLR